MKKNRMTGETCIGVFMLAFFFTALLVGITWAMAKFFDSLLMGGLIGFFFFALVIVLGLAACIEED